MTLLGHIQNGVVVFNQPVSLPEGTQVRIETIPSESGVVSERRSLLEQLGDVVGACDDLPEDLAENHDHYLYGTPKRS